MAEQTTMQQVTEESSDIHDCGCGCGGAACLSAKAEPVFVPLIIHLEESKKAPEQCDGGYDCDCCR